MTSEIVSLIVPTRGRPESLRRFLQSLEATTVMPSLLEVLLVVDDDDPASREVICEGLNLRHVVVPPGQTMGVLNRAGYAASRGRFLMLLNDDVVARTPGWDSVVRRCFAMFPDDIVLVHVNDTVMQRHLCTFPIVSRTFCELVGGICPEVYCRYRIDDHIEDHFNLLHALGRRRTIYAPDIIFEHANHVTNDVGMRQYFSDSDILARDAPIFEALFPERKRAVLKLLAHMESSDTDREDWQRCLEGIHDPFALRTPDRQFILTPNGRMDPEDYDRQPTFWRRLATCLRERGMRGLWDAAHRRLISLPRP